MRNITIIIFISIVTIIVPVSLAVDSTPSAGIKSKLEELKKEIASKAAQIKKEVDKKLRNKAYAGKIKTISETSLTLAASSGPKIVSINQDTEYESKIKSKKKFSQKTLSLGDKPTSGEDFIAALGDIDETGVLTAKKIILLNPIPQTLNPKSYLWGQVIAISDKLVTIKNRGNKNVAVSFPDQKVKLNDFVILTGIMGKNDIFEAEFAYIIPQGGFIKPKKVATPSAKVKSPTR